jgi:hypothetical protein
MKFNNKYNFLILLFSFFFLVSSCGGKKSDASKIPTNALERAKQNVKEGRGMSIGNVLNRNKNTNYEFSTSNPMWRASLETLDFLPLTVVDYSGGMIITDWYGNDSNLNESLKITLRFLSNEVRVDSLKVIVHQKKCAANSNCSIKILNSKIQEELLTAIIRKAALLENLSKSKSKKK